MKLTHATKARQFSFSSIYEINTCY